MVWTGSRYQKVGSSKAAKIVHILFHGKLLDYYVDLDDARKSSIATLKSADSRPKERFICCCQNFWGNAGLRKQICWLCCQAETHFKLAYSSESSTWSFCLLHNWSACTQPSTINSYSKRGLKTLRELLAHYWWRDMEWVMRYEANVKSELINILQPKADARMYQLHMGPGRHD